MAKIDVDFVWFRARDYELVSSSRGAAIRQKGRIAPYSPLRTEKAHLIFAGLDGSPEQCVGFAKRFGFLEMLPGQGDEETVTDWRHSIKRVQGWISVLGDDPSGGLLATPGIKSNSSITSVDVLISTDPPGPRHLVFRPQTLLNAMLLQLAQSSAIATCQQCGQWFEVGGEGKRTIAKFCSDRCRNRFNYERRIGK
jgi:hypothetical protein